jgi:hypothetical protein
VTVPDSIELIYRQFARYPLPANIWVCEQCGPRWSADSIRATPLRTLSLEQLSAVHVMALDDDSLRHFFPRLIEVMLQTDAPVFDFRLADLKSRLPAWESDERDAVRNLADAVWNERMDRYPCALGYFSDSPSAVDFLDWCGLDLTAHLDSLVTAQALSAARHLADLVDAALTMRDPFETAPKTTVLQWLKNPAVGDRLQAAFFAADADDVAAQLSKAHELWTVCAS